MPIYEYSCTACSHKFDQLVKMSAPDPACPECGKETRKLVSAAGFILKGGGWYKDHYGLKKSSGGSESSGGGGESSAPKSSDTKGSGGGTSGSGTPAAS